MSTSRENSNFPVLYGYAKSSCHWRVRAALAVKSVDFQTKYFNPFEATEEEKQQYAKLNPLGQIPLLEIDGNFIAQSVAILEYLEETRPEPSLLPKDTAKRAKAREIVELINSGIQPLQNPVVARKRTNNPTKQTEWQVCCW